MNSVYKKSNSNSGSEEFFTGTVENLATDEWIINWDIYWFYVGHA